MKITALYDEAGVIIAAAAADPDYRGPVPSSAEGCEVAELEVPDHMADRGLEAICAHMRVDRQQRCLTDAAD